MRSDFIFQISDYRWFAFTSLLEIIFDLPIGFPINNIISLFVPTLFIFIFCFSFSDSEEKHI